MTKKRTNEEHKKLAANYEFGEFTKGKLSPKNRERFERVRKRRHVRTSPEETEAVQVFARRLVEDFGYPKELISTHPQHRVRRRPSDSAKSYPVDIAVFQDEAKHEDDLYIVVECKRKTRKDGLAQLKTYLDLSPAEIGVWFNGTEHVYLRKIFAKKGRIKYEEIPTIPRYGQRIKDIGRFRRKDLVPPSNLKAVFRDVRNHLAGNATGITRDEALAQEIINVLFCKIYDEINTGKNDILTFRCGTDEDPKEVKKRISVLFESKVKAEYADVFTKADTIRLDPKTLTYVVGELQNYCIVEANRDAVGDAFEVFIGPALRGGEGQFFTPRNVVKAVVELLDPQPGEQIIDPACGSGGFLIMALEHVWREVDKMGAEKGWSAVQIDRKKRDVATRYFRGLDKDSFLAKVTKAYMEILGDGRGGVFCANSLTPPGDWKPEIRAKIAPESFDVVLTNPPFGKKIKVRGADLLSQFELAYKWKTPRKRSGHITKTSTLHTDRPPQLLFLERCLQLLKPGGRLGIVLPESLLGNTSYEFVIKFIMNKAVLEGVITLPEPLFKTSGKGGTHTKVGVLLLRKLREGETTDNRATVFMSDVKWCGHDSRGNPTVRKDKSGRSVLLDEVPEVPQRYRVLRSGRRVKHDHLGFLLPVSRIANRILIPKYYNPEIDARLDGLQGTHRLVTISELVSRGVLSLATGVEVGKMAYGTGMIPFIRSSDLANWEIKADFKHGVSQEIYDEYGRRSEIQAEDILMVRDGTYLIGTTAMVTEHDLPMLYQSHLFRVRVEDRREFDPYLLLACLNAPIVKRQIRSKQFTQDIIDTLGWRVEELVLPIPADARERKRLAAQTKKIVTTRARLRVEAGRVSLDVEGMEELPEEDRADDVELP